MSAEDPTQLPQPTKQKTGRTRSPYALKQSGSKFLMTRLVFLLLSIVVVIAVGWVMIPSLWNDWHNGDHWKADRLAQIDEGQCPRATMIFMCEANLIASDGHTAYIAYFFIDFHLGDYQTVVLQSTENPAILSTQVGIDYLSNRIITFIVIELVVFFFMVFLLFQIRGALKNRKYGSSSLL